MTSDGIMRLQLHWQSIVIVVVIVQMAYWSARKRIFKMLAIILECFANILALTDGTGKAFCEGNK